MAFVYFTTECSPCLGRVLPKAPWGEELCDLWGLL